MKTYRVEPPPAHTAAPTGTPSDPSASKSGEPPERRWSGWQPQANGSFWLLTVLTLVCAVGQLRPPPRLPTLQPVSAAPCAVPVELPGQGVSCLTTEKAQQLGLTAGDVWPMGPHGERAAGPPARMAARRLLAAQVLLDPETATAAELEALPDLGPHLAQRIVEARAGRAARGSPPLRTQAALLEIPGLGKRRLQRLLPFLVPLP